MKTLLSPLLLSFALGISARPGLLFRRGYECPEGSCSFTLSVNGEPVYENPVDEHQLAFGGTEPGEAVEFCINEEGQITDNAGVCGITQDTGHDQETTQFQCDQGMESKFTINCEGYLEYNGSPNFYACLAEPSIGYNIYATPPDQQQCASYPPKEIQLKASGCYEACEQQNQCPGYLEGEWQFPHLIIPISKSEPDYAPGTSYDGKVTSDVSSIFNFDIPESYEGQTCRLVFDFPEQSQLQTSSYTLSGSGMVDFSLLKMAATLETSYSNAPGVETDLGMYTLSPGHSYTIWTGECQAGQAVAFEMSTNSNTDLWWFQDYNICPIGLYVLASN